MTAGQRGGGEPGLPAVSPEAPPLRGTPWISQDWLDVVFVHWRVDVSAVAPLLPAGAHPDTMAPDGTDDGATTWVGLIGFRFTDTRFPPLGGLGRAGSVGDFVEVNVRVYTRDDQGRRGVAFLSLDAGKLLPTIGARVATGLPYWWAHAAIRKTDGRVGYAMRRHGTHLRSTFDVRVGDAVDEPTPLETFLTARWGMHVRAGRRDTLLAERARGVAAAPGVPRVAAGRPGGGCGAALRTVRTGAGLGAVLAGGDHAVRAGTLSITLGMMTASRIPHT